MTIISCFGITISDGGDNRAALYARDNGVLPAFSSLVVDLLLEGQKQTLHVRPRSPTRRQRTSSLVSLCARLPSYAELALQLSYSPRQWSHLAYQGFMRFLIMFHPSMD